MSESTSIGGGAGKTEPDGGVIRARAPRRRWILRLLQFLLVTYAGLAVVFFLLQTWLIFPGASTQGQTEAVVEPPPGTELIQLTTEQGDRVTALFGNALTADGSPRSDTATCPSILFFYGNAMCLRDTLAEFEQFRRLGTNVLIPDYVGYGMSGGKPSEAGCRATAEAALGYLRSRPDLNPSKIVVAGWSLGGAVALDVAARHPVAGVATFSTFTRMSELSRRIVPFLPGSLLLRHPFRSDLKVAQIGCPILIGHGRRDRIVPFSMADQLAGAAKSTVSRVTLAGADHNDFFESGGAPLWQSIHRFIADLPPRP